MNQPIKAIATTTPESSRSPLSVDKYQPHSFDELKDFARLVVKSELCGVKKAEDALLIMMTGAELGLSVLQALRREQVLKRKPE